MGEEFQETIKRLHESFRDGSKLEPIPDASLSCISTSSSDAPDISPLSQTNYVESHFLAKLASEKKIMKNDDSGTALSGSEVIELDEGHKSRESANKELLPCKTSQQEEAIPAHSALYTDTPANTSNSSQVNQDIPNHSGTYDLNDEDVPFRSECTKTVRVSGHGMPAYVGTPLLTSTPTSGDHKKNIPVKEESTEVDPSLLCSQTISFIDSERNFSSSSLERRPTSPTPDDRVPTATEPSCVILGPFEDSTLDYFIGLKTTFPTVKTLDYEDNNDIDLEKNSIETWDKFLDHAMQPVNGDYPSFSDVNFTKVESESSRSDANAPSNSSDILGSSFEKSDPEKMAVKNTSGPMDNQSIEISTFEANVGKNSILDLHVSCEARNVNDFPSISEAVSLSPTSENQGLASSCLVVPSLHVIEATPISSGRNSPYDSKSGENGMVSIMTERNITDSQLKEDKMSTAHIVKIDSNHSCSQDVSFPISVTDRFVMAHLDKTEIGVQKFDPDLPCCNQSHQNFIPGEKDYDMRDNEFNMFSNNATNLQIESVCGFVRELTSDCFVNSKLQSDVVCKDFKPVIPLFSKGFSHKESDGHGEMLEDEDDLGLGVAKNLTPDDERSSDSGFRDKGSLSESCEDACDEKYNLEDIEAELEEAFSKGVFARHDSPTSNKGAESDCDPVDESFSVTLTDVEKQRAEREAEISRSKDPCHRLDVLLRSDQVLEPLSVDVESSTDFFGTSPALSPIPQSSGWYLHPPQSHEEASAEPVSGNDSSYFSFSLDEEFVNAIRNELREKLPCAQLQREESQPQLSDEEEHSDQELDSEDSPSRERTNIMIHYKTYPAPLSPILEERESLCSEICSPLGGSNSSSCSGHSPAHAVDHCSSNHGNGSICHVDDDVQHIESECPAEVDGDLSDDCGDCLEHDTLPLDTGLLSPSSYSNIADVNDVCLNGEDGDDDDDDDVLVVNTETNEATLLESPKPFSKFSVLGNDECDDSANEDFVPDFLSVAGSYQLPEIKLNNSERMHSDLYQNCRPLNLPAFQQSSVELECEDDNENDAMTPDSITCEKSFSERTEEDSAVGLALSEVMTPDSLTGESQWTSVQMCDSGFGTIGSRVPSNMTTSESFERKSPELSSTDLTLSGQDSSAIQDDCPQTVTEIGVKADISEQIESSETTQSTEDSESSVSFSTNSVVSSMNLYSTNDIKSIKMNFYNNSLSTDSNKYNGSKLKNQNIKQDVQSFIEEETKSSNTQSLYSVHVVPSFCHLSPISLKEIARNALGKEWNSKGLTLAFNSEVAACVNQETSISSTGMNKIDVEESEAQSVKHGQNEENLSFETKTSHREHSESSVVDQPLQTLAFSDSDVIEPSFPGPGHIVVSSMIAPMTPSDNTITPGTLAFNESPVSSFINNGKLHDI